MSIREHKQPFRRTVPLCPINTALFGLQRTDRSVEPLPPDSPLQRGEVVQRLEVLSPEEQGILQQIRTLILKQFDSEVEIDITCFLVGSSARDELRGSRKKRSDLDVLVLGITQEMLLSVGFLEILREHFTVKIGSGSIDKRKQYLQLYDKSTGTYLADIDVPYHPESDDSAITPILALQRVAVSMTAIEILANSYQAASGYKGAISALSEDPVVDLPLAPGPSSQEPVNITASLRFHREIAGTSYFTTRLETLNKLRDWWLRFRGVEHSPEEIQRISASVNTALNEAFEQANANGLGELYFSLLVHTGTFGALYPVAWANASHRLFDTAGEPKGSIFGYLRENGFNLENLEKALDIFMVAKAKSNIAQLGITDLSSTWYTSYRENIAIYAQLLDADFPVEIFLPDNPGTVKISDMLCHGRPELLHKDTGTLAERARYKFWNVMGIYVEALTLTKALNSEAVMSLAGQSAGVDPPTSIFDRFGIIYARVNTEMIRLLAMGEFEKVCRIAVEWEANYAQPNIDGVKARLDAARTILNAEQMYSAEKSIRLRTFFKSHLQGFLAMGWIDEAIMGVAAVLFENLTSHSRYRFVFD